ncbi:MAG: hypothetical protein ABMB14_23205, partial [Myxococcota bacterium]
MQIAVRQAGVRQERDPLRPLHERHERRHERGVVCRPLPPMDPHLRAPLGEPDPAGARGVPSQQDLAGLGATADQVDASAERGGPLVEPAQRLRFVAGARLIDRRPLVEREVRRIREGLGRAPLRAEPGDRSGPAGRARPLGVQADRLVETGDVLDPLVAEGVEGFAVPPLCQQQLGEVGRRAVPLDEVCRAAQVDRDEQPLTKEEGLGLGEGEDRLVRVAARRQRQALTPPSHPCELEALSRHPFEALPGIEGRRSVAATERDPALDLQTPGLLELRRCCPGCLQVVDCPRQVGLPERYEREVELHLRGVGVPVVGRAARPSRQQLQRLGEDRPGLGQIARDGAVGLRQLQQTPRVRVQHLRAPARVRLAGRRGDPGGELCQRLAVPAADEAPDPETLRLGRSIRTPEPLRAPASALERRQRHPMIPCRLSSDTLPVVCRP